MSDGPHDDDERRRLACLHTQRQLSKDAPA